MRTAFFVGRSEYMYTSIFLFVCTHMHSIPMSRDGSRKMSTRGFFNFKTVSVSSQGESMAKNPGWGGGSMGPAAVGGLEPRPPQHWIRPCLRGSTETESHISILMKSLISQLNPTINLEKYKYCAKSRTWSRNLTNQDTIILLDRAFIWTQRW